MKECYCVQRLPLRCVVDLYWRNFDNYKIIVSYFMETAIGQVLVTSDSEKKIKN